MCTQELDSLGWNSHRASCEMCGFGVSVSWFPELSTGDNDSVSFFVLGGQGTPRSRRWSSCRSRRGWREGAGSPGLGLVNPQNLLKHFNFVAFSIILKCGVFMAYLLKASLYICEEISWHGVSVIALVSLYE